MTARWIKWALIASLAVNVAVATAVIGAMLTGGPIMHDDRRGFGGPPEIAALSRGLDRDARRALFMALRADGGLGDARARMRTAQAVVVDALRAEPFDRAAFETAMRMQRDLQGEIAGRGITMLGKVIADLSVEDRVALAEHLSRPRTRK